MLLPSRALASLRTIRGPLAATTAHRLHPPLTNVAGARLVRKTAAPQEQECLPLNLVVLTPNIVPAVVAKKTTKVLDFVKSRRPTCSICKLEQHHGQRAAALQPQAAPQQASREVPEVCLRLASEPVADRAGDRSRAWHHIPKSFPCEDTEAARSEPRQLVDIRLAINLLLVRQSTGILELEVSKGPARGQTAVDPRGVRLRDFASGSFDSRALRW
mmetsp:Transcript_7679/g.19537  ORF Transcript_7679/g.19537 Transcript_7679/m.19537 type:complete len:216 (+) Transcript_7679:98-745(+)